MEIVLERMPSNYGLLTLTMKREDFMNEYHKILKDYSKKATIKGFRPGKAPLNVVEMLYGRTLKFDVFNQEVSKNISEYLKNNQIELVFQPFYKGNEITKEMLDKQSSFSLEFELCIQPPLTIDLTQLHLTDYELSISETDINKVIDKIRYDYSTVEDIEQVEKDCILYGKVKSVEGEVINENATLPIKEVIEDVFVKIEGKKRGESFTFEAQSIFTDSQKLFFLFGNDPNTASKVGHFDFVIETIKKVIPAALNEELYQKIYGQNTIKSEEEFREKIKEVIYKTNENTIDTLMVNQFYHLLMATYKIDFPKELVRRYISPDEPEKVDEKQLNKTLKRLQWQVILKNLSKLGNIEITHDEVFEQAQKEIQERMMDMGMAEMANNPSIVKNFTKNFLEREQGKNLKDTENLLFMKKLISLAKEKCQVEKKYITSLAELDELTVKSREEIKALQEEPV